MSDPVSKTTGQPAWETRMNEIGLDEDDAQDVRVETEGTPSNE